MANGKSLRPIHQHLKTLSGPPGLFSNHKPKKLKVGETPTERVGISGELQAREAPQDAEPGAEG